MESPLDTIDKIHARIEALKEYVEILEGLQNITLAELEKDPIKKGAIERFLQLSIEACVDIAEMIISDQRFRTPQTASEAIEILGEREILDKDFAEKFTKAVGFRNILIHDYVRINYDLVLKNLKTNLSDFHRFIKEVLKFLQ